MISTTTTAIISTEQVLEQSQIYEKQRTDQEGSRCSSEQASLCSNNQIDLVRQQMPESGKVYRCSGCLTGGRE